MADERADRTAALHHQASVEERKVEMEQKRLDAQAADQKARWELESRRFEFETVNKAEDRKQGLKTVVLETLQAAVKANKSAEELQAIEDMMKRWI